VWVATLCVYAGVSQSSRFVRHAGSNLRNRGAVSRWTSGLREAKCVRMCCSCCSLVSVCICIPYLSVSVQVKRLCIISCYNYVISKSLY
jgi:hypothetical protein